MHVDLFANEVTLKTEDTNITCNDQNALHPSLGVLGGCSTHLLLGELRSSYLGLPR